MIPTPHDVQHDATMPDGIEEIVLETIERPVIARAEKPRRTLTNGSVIEQSVHEMTARLARTNAMENMSRYLRAYREEVLGLNQIDMAWLLDVSKMTYQRMESGHPGVSIEAWLRAMQAVRHLSTISSMDFARDRATKARMGRIAKEHLDQLKERIKQNPERFYG